MEHGIVHVLLLHELRGATAPAVCTSHVEISSISNTGCKQTEAYWKPMHLVTAYKRLMDNNQSMDVFINQSMDGLMDQSMDGLINQSMDGLINQSINQWMDGTMNHQQSSITCYTLVDPLVADDQ